MDIMTLLSIKRQIISQTAYVSIMKLK